MEIINSHRDLKVWQKAMDLVVLIYELVKSLPPEENYRLVSQITRAAISVPANIAEGHARATSKDYAQFLSVAKGSLMETDTFVLLMLRLKYISTEKAQTALNLIAEIGKMLSVLRKNLLSSSLSKTQPLSPNT